MKILTTILIYLIIGTLTFALIKYTEKIPGEWFIIALITFIIGTLFLFIINPEDFIVNTKKKGEEKLVKALENMISNGRFKLSDISLLAENYQLEHKEIEKIVISVFANKLEQEGPSEKTSLLKETIEKLKQSEPFINLPESIRIYLLQIKTDDESQKESVRMLANSISDFMIKAERQNKRERIKASISLVIGLIGLILTIYFSLKT